MVYASSKPSRPLKHPSTTGTYSGAGAAACTVCPLGYSCTTGSDTTSQCAAGTTNNFYFMSQTLLVGIGVQLYKLCLWV